MRARSGVIGLFGVGVVALMLLAAACSPDTSSESKTAGGSRGAASGRPGAPGSGYEPKVVPANFVGTVDNPLFPLKPGTTYKLRSETDEGVEHETITVTNDKKKVAGVATTVVEDVVTLDGKPKEKTVDWYAQDKEGNVWYFGEDTAEYKNGKVVSRKGSWEAGVDGAKPGIIMSARPRVTDSYRQEYYKGEAEDMFWVVATGQPVSVPYGSFENAVLTLEWTPLEPGVVSQKYYVPGVGLVAEKNLSGGTEDVQLVGVTHSKFEKRVAGRTIVSLVLPEVVR